MSVKTNELKQATSVNAEDYLLADSPTAGTVRVPLSAAAEYLDAELLKSGTQLHAALSNKAIWSMLPNPNLLDNGYFADPVNQRAKTEYTSGYCIDRYLVEGREETPHKISLNSNGIMIAPYSAIRQTMENRFKDGTTVTFSVIIDSNLYTTTFAINNSLAYTRVLEKGHIVLAYNGSANSLQIYNKSDTITMTVTAAKLELGPHQTLAHKEGDVWVLNDPPPNKALELTKCQRYQIVMFGSNDVATSTSAGFAFAHSSIAALATIYTPTNLRTAPAIKFNSCDLRSMSDGNIFYPITSMTVARVSGNAVKLNIICSGGGLTTGEIYLISKSEDGFLIFDANL